MVKYMQGNVCLIKFLIQNGVKQGVRPLLFTFVLSYTITNVQENQLRLKFLLCFCVKIQTSDMFLNKQFLRFRTILMLCASSSGTSILGHLMVKVKAIWS
jgi:hypothetical protein